MLVKSYEWQIVQPSNNGLNYIYEIWNALIRSLNGNWIVNHKILRFNEIIKSMKRYEIVIGTNKCDYKNRKERCISLNKNQVIIHKQSTSV